MRTTFLLLLITGLFYFNSCQTVKCIEGDGTSLTVKPGLDNFTSVENAGALNVTIELGLPGLTISGDKNIIETISAKVKNSRLIVDTEGCYENARVNIVVTSFSILGVINSGSGNTTIESIRGNGALMLDNTGSGNLYFNDLGNTESLIVSLKGSGNIEGKGGSIITDLSLTNTGSGNYNSIAYPTRTSNINSSGSGDNHVWSTIKTDINLSGSGNIILKGESQIYDNVTGSGELKRVF